MSDLQADDNPAAQVWRSPHLRSRIFDHADKKTLLQLLRVDRDCFSRAVKQIWRHQIDPVVTEQTLNAVSNPVGRLSYSFSAALPTDLRQHRYMAYSLAITSIRFQAQDLPPSGLAPYMIRFPNLTSAEVGQGHRIFDSTLRAADQDGVDFKRYISWKFTQEHGRRAVTDPFLAFDLNDTRSFDELGFAISRIAVWGDVIPGAEHITFRIVRFRVKWADLEYSSINCTRMISSARY